MALIVEGPEAVADAGCIVGAIATPKNKTRELGCNLHRIQIYKKIYIYIKKFPKKNLQICSTIIIIIMEQVILKIIVIIHQGREDIF
jgi:hypothetical protein